MIEVTLQLFPFEELSPKSQERAVNICRKEVASHRQELDNIDFQDTLYGIEKVLGINVKSLDVDDGITYSFLSDHWNELSDDPKFLLRYLNNVVFPNASKGKYFSSFKSKNFVGRRSKILTESEWNFTGAKSDHSASEDISNALDAVKRGWSIHRFVWNLLYNFSSAWNDTALVNRSDEAVKESLMNEEEYIFLQSGTPFPLKDIPSATS